MHDRVAASQEPLLHDAGSWDEITELFDALIDLPGAEQAERLARADPAVRAPVERLLAAACGSGVLDTPLAEHAPVPERGFLPAGERVGAFEIVRTLGRGGMGEVYLAQRADGSFLQKVAVKLLRIDAIGSTREFARERELLARMDHPGIARLIDGGILANGRPWMAMEFVSGEPITAWARRKGASLTERLDLFDQLADAVAFAHTNLVIHRDIKPGNVLVDDLGRVRLLDFGIAKLSGDLDPDATATQALLTPYYAAPEQFSGAEITTATDVHGLGLLLHHLVAGVGPWGEVAGLGLMVRRVIDDEPPLPSRTTDPAAGGLPSSQLRGDIDAIVAMALRRDPKRRYGSVVEMRADVRRVLEARPVHARAGNWRYRSARYVRRNFWQVASAGALSVSLFAGAGLFAWQAARAEQQRDAALAEARRSEAIVQVLNGVFAQGRALDPEGRQSAKDLLLSGTRRLLERSGPDARSGAAAVALADMFFAMQDPASAAEMLRSALSRGIGRDDPLSVARMEARLANVVLVMGGPEDPAALIDKASLALSPELGARPDDLLTIARLRATQARIAGDYDEALRITAANFGRAETVYREAPGDLLSFYNNAVVYAMEGNRMDLAGRWLARSEPLLTRPEARDTIEGLGIQQLRGVHALRSGNPEEAVETLVSVVERRRATFGESAGLASDLTQLAKAQLAAGDPVRALRSAEEAQPLFTRLAGPSAPPVLVAAMIRAEAVAATGRVAAAEAILDGLSEPVGKLPNPSLYVGQYAMSRALVAIAAGKRGEAKERLAEARKIFAALGPPGRSAAPALERIAARIEALR